MGRRDAVQTILEVVAECRRLLPNLIVTWEPGWETRGNGTSANYSFGSLHHTATPASLSRPFPTQNLLRNGRTGLPGPLCNVGTPYCTAAVPRLHVMAAHPANHGGASRASGPVPKLSLFNPTSIGNEIDYAGLTPMSDGQLLVGHVFTRAVANVLARGNVEVVRGHAETSVTGKWDPGYANGRTYDMNGWRRTAAAITGPPAAPAPVIAKPVATPSSSEEFDMLVEIEPGETSKIPVPTGRTYRINVVSDSVFGQQVYGKQVSPGRVVGLFFGHAFGTGEKEWELFVGETHNIEIPCAATSFVEITNKGVPQKPENSRPIAVTLTPVA